MGWYSSSLKSLGRTWQGFPSLPLERDLEGIVEILWLEYRWPRSVLRLWKMKCEARTLPREPKSQSKGFLEIKMHHSRIIEKMSQTHTAFSLNTFTFEEFLTLSLAGAKYLISEWKVLPAPWNFSSLSYPIANKSSSPRA
jgi:hypothetical protein